MADERPGRAWRPRRDGIDGLVGRLPARTGRRLLYAGIVGHLLVGVVHLARLYGQHEPGLYLAFETTVFLGAPSTMVAIVHRVEAVRPTAAEYWRMVLGGLLGTVLAIGLAGVYLLELRLAGAPPVRLPSVLLLAADVGGPVGLALAWREVLARRSAARARAAGLRADLLEVQERRLNFLNRILRHRLLNGLSVVKAAVDNLRHGRDDPDRWLDLIDERSAGMIEEVEQIRVAVRSLTDGHPTHGLDLDAVLEAELTEIRDRFPGAVVRADLGPVPSVLAPESIGLAFHHLLENAVVHNRSARPRLDVRLRAGPRGVTVVVADDGPGIADDRKTAYFERGELGVDSLGEGLGLYLADLLTTAAGGRIRVTDNEPSGTKVVLELPADVGGAGQPVGGPAPLEGPPDAASGRTD